MELAVIKLNSVKGDNIRLFIDMNVRLGSNYAIYRTTAVLYIFLYLFPGTNILVP